MKRITAFWSESTFDFALPTFDFHFPSEVTGLVPSALILPRFPKFVTENPPSASQPWSCLILFRFPKFVTENPPLSQPALILFDPVQISLRACCVKIPRDQPRSSLVNPSGLTNQVSSNHSAIPRDLIEGLNATSSLSTKSLGSGLKVFWV